MLRASLQDQYNDGLDELETRGLHSRPDPRLAARISGLRVLLTRTELVTTLDENGQRVARPLSHVTAPS